MESQAGTRAPSEPGADAPRDGAGGSGSTGTARARTSRATTGELIQRYALIAVWIVVIVVFSLLRPETYFTSGNFQTIFGSQAVLLILALGLIIPLTTGDFDLSIASVLALCSMVLALLTVDKGWALLPAIIAVLLIGLAVGLLNGGLVVLLGIDSFIVTLGTGTVLNGVTLWISGSNTVSGVPNVLTDWIIAKRIFGISLAFWYGLLLMLALWYVFTYTALGRRLLFVGRGRNVSRLSGIAVGRLRWGALATSGLHRRARRRHLHGHARRRGPHLGAAVPAARVRRRLPRRHGHPSRALQPVGNGDRGVLPGLRHHGPAAPRRRVVRPAAVLRRRARPRRGAEPARPPAGDRRRGGRRGGLGRQRPPEEVLLQPGEVTVDARGDEVRVAVAQCRDRVVLVGLRRRPCCRSASDSGSGPRPSSRKT
jgi:predicted ABC-type sugar transport system permease subunit